MAKVYVVQENPRLNYNDAERFGDVVFMTAKEFKAMPGSLVNTEILRDVESHMKGFNPDGDFLLLTGNPIILGYAFYLAFMKANHLNALQWDNFRQAYVPFRFNP